ncbi:hypothetical protein [Mycobacterium lepromatosis]|uniref:hypothetical protein n=1 Tax=Mycobacterium lepromatosis TaxID=480418 RepID=UPI0012E08F84|nr:hypothetical protein [Mycobacterium lepromatosis]
MIVKQRPAFLREFAAPLFVLFLAPLLNGSLGDYVSFVGAGFDVVFVGDHEV